LFLNKEENKQKSKNNTTAYVWPPPPFGIHFDGRELNLIHMATTWKILHM